MIRVAFDIGGTFTDFVLHDSQGDGGGDSHFLKIPSTPDDPGRAVLAGLESLFQAAGVEAGDVASVLHATTVATNAVLERKGAPTGLITTEGFRDVLIIGRQKRYETYDLYIAKPEPLVPRRHIVEVAERLDNAGAVVTPLDMASVDRAIDGLVAAGRETVAVSLLHAYANPEHEQAIRARIKARAPGLSVSLSSDVAPKFREYERTNTTAANAYIKPIVERYIEGLQDALRQRGYVRDLFIMQSSGGLVSPAIAKDYPIRIIESGPAAGVLMGGIVGKEQGREHVITFDMGGTTAKASLVEDGDFTRSLDYQVGGGIMIGSRLMSGAGYHLKIPAIDLAEVGAGGGSLVWIDAGGSMQIGPQSAGAMPGPVCYGMGGEDPTVTDANVILGYLNPDYLVGGELALQADKSRAVFQEQIAGPMRLDLAHAAYGAHQIVISNMIRAIRAISSERGRDPRDYALFAFGGNGPLFAAGMAKALDMKRIVVPPFPGLFSSFGLLYADVEHHYSRSMMQVLRDTTPQALNEIWGGLEAQAREQLSADGYRPEQIDIRRTANMHYKGQIFELTVPAPSGDFDAEKIAELEERFGQEHERTYGHRAGPEEPVMLVNAQLIGRAIPDHPPVPDRLKGMDARAATQKSSRQAYFGPETGWLEAQVLSRDDLATERTGPLIVEEYDATCLVPPGARATQDDFGNIIIELP